MRPRATFLFLAFTVLLAFAATSAQAAPTYCNAQCSTSSCRTDICTHPETGTIITCYQWGVYDASDNDCDGIDNGPDNCPNDSNPGQQDCDGDDTGNACDSENGTFVKASGTRQLCYVDGRRVLFWTTVQGFFEARYEDVSSCDSPDIWRHDGWQAKTCPLISPFNCCNDIFSDSECLFYLDNNLCQY